MTTDEQRRERHRDAMRRVDVMNELLRGVSDDYRRATALLDEYFDTAKELAYQDDE
jgi:hypothetical protein